MGHSAVHRDSQPDFLLASDDAELLSRMEPLLASHPARVRKLHCANELLEVLGEQPAVLLALDGKLPGMAMGQLLAALRAHPGGAVLPIVLFSDSVTAELRDRLREGVISDVVPPRMSADFLQLRVEAALAAHERQRELERLRERAASQAQTDTLTGMYSRAAMLSLLFRETDRVQRMKTSLGLILFDIDDFGHWNLRLGPGACDELLGQAAARVGRLLRSYDLLGRVGKDEFLAALPGCSVVNTMQLAERVKQEVFAAPFMVGGQAIRLSACFAVACSQGRSPVVVLRDLEEGLALAKQEGPETIRLAEWQDAKPAPVEFLTAEGLGLGGRV